MPFPIHPPKQMPCPHWKHFPISPVDNKPPNLLTNTNGIDDAHKPPEPVSYGYCIACKKITAAAGAGASEIEASSSDQCSVWS